MRRPPPRREVLPVIAAILGIAACDGPPTPEPLGDAALAPPPARDDLRSPPARDPGAPLVFRPYGSDPPAVPRIDALVVSTTREEGAGDEGVRVRVDARHEGHRVFGYELLVYDDRFLIDPLAEPRILRYVLYPAGELPLEYVDARDGRPLLPRAAPPDWLPRGFGGSADSVRFLGRAFRRVVRDEPAGPWPRNTARRVLLDPDLLIATSRDFRDDGTGRHGDDWRWVPLGPSDYETMVAAGFSLFESRSRDLRVVASLPAFVVAAEGWERKPDLILRGSFLGAVMFADEPAVHVTREWPGGPATSPAEVVAAIGAATRRTIDSDDKYGRGFLARRIETPGFRYGEVHQPPYPVWEAIASAAWYELEAGAEGWCLEARLRPAEFAANVERAVGVPFPGDAISCIRLHLALARGAARRFDAPWGVSVYGQMDDAAADLLFPLAWNAGATYFWMWTSDRDHHVPHARQLELARSLRVHAGSRPRGTAAAVTRQATTALVLPWGYALDEFSLDGAGARLWGMDALPLTAVNEAGVPHRDVLAAAVREVVGLLAREGEFDILFLREGEQAEGYAESHRVGTDARVIVRRS